jgi:hypothetical protein
MGVPQDVFSAAHSTLLNAMVIVLIVSIQRIYRLYLAFYVMQQSVLPT